MSVSSRKSDRQHNKFDPWSLIRFCDEVPKRLTTSASYPKVDIRASGMSWGSSKAGHGPAALFSVQVSSLLPVKPWTKTILYSQIGRHGVSDQSGGMSYSTDGFATEAGSQSTLMPVGNGSLGCFSGPSLFHLAHFGNKIDIAVGDSTYIMILRTGKIKFVNAP